MPYINVKTNAKLTAEAKEIIKRRLFDTIGILPGKSDRYRHAHITKTDNRKAF